MFKVKFSITFEEVFHTNTMTHLCVKTSFPCRINVKNIFLTDVNMMLEKIVLGTKQIRYTGLQDVA